MRRIKRSELERIKQRIDDCKDISKVAEEFGISKSTVRKIIELYC